MPTFLSASQLPPDSVSWFQASPECVGLVSELDYHKWYFHYVILMQVLMYSRGHGAKTGLLLVNPVRPTPSDNHLEMPTPVLHSQAGEVERCFSLDYGW